MMLAWKESRLGFEAGAEIEQVRKGAAAAIAEGTARVAVGEALMLGAAADAAGEASAFAEPTAMPATIDPVARSTKTTPSAENNQAFGCFAITADIPPRAAGTPKPGWPYDPPAAEIGVIGRIVVCPSDTGNTDEGSPEAPEAASSRASRRVSGGFGG